MQKVKEKLTHCKLITTDATGYMLVTDYEQWQKAKDNGQLSVHVKLGEFDEILTLEQAKEVLLELPA